LSLSVQPAITGTAILPTEDKWDDGDGRSLEFLGVCDVTPEAARCWKRDGSPHKWLETQIWAVLSGDYQRNKTFAVGKKNRMIVFNDLTEQIGQATFTAEDGKQLYANHLYSRESGYRLTWVNVAAEPDQRAVTLIASVRALRTSSATVPFAQGKTVSAANMTVTYGTAEKLPDEVTKIPAQINRPEVTRRLPQWRIGISMDKDRQTKAGSSLIAFDRAGNRIDYVDNAGKPLSPIVVADEIVRAIKEFDHNSFPNDVSWRRGAGTRIDSKTDPNKPAIVTAVDPRYIASIQFGGERSIRIPFNGIPLDPRLGN
jgi:hypothetical protein